MEGYKEAQMSDGIVLEGEQITAYQLMVLRRGLILECSGSRMRLTAKANLKQVAEGLAGRKFTTKVKALEWVEQTCRELGV